MNVYHQIICLAKALDEHGIILNLDDMCMEFSYLVKFADAFTIPISKTYPLQPPSHVKNEMEKHGFRNVWAYYAETIKQAFFHKKPEKKRRWHPF